MPNTWQELKGMDQKDFQKRFDSGEFDGFIKDSEFLTSINSGSLFEKSDTLNEQPPAVVVERPPAESPLPPESKGGAPSEPFWKQKGFATEQEFLSKFDTLSDEFRKTQDSLNRLNADRGKEGLKVKKQLEAEQKKREQTEKELETLRNAALIGNAGITIPDMPMLPELESLEDFKGDKRKEYEDKVRDWQKSVSKVITELHQDRTKHQQAITELSSKVAGAAQAVEDEQKMTAKQRQDKELFNLIDEIDRFQTQSSPFSTELKTSKPFSQINQDILAGNSALYSENDLKAFERLKTLATKYRRFDESGAIDITAPKVFETIEDLHLIELRKSGKLNEYLKSVEQKASLKGREQVINAIDRNSRGAQELPSGAGEREDTIRRSTEEEDMEKLKKYAAMPSKDIEKNPAAMKEYVGLLDKFGMSASAPAGWREKIQPQ